MKRYRKILPVASAMLLLACSAWLFITEKYALLAVVLATAACLPFVLSLEQGGARSGREIALLAALTALTVVGRIVFAPLPAFKPVTALTVIVGIAFGAQAGAVTGSMSALISNIYFGQGPWTPFQMAAWGAIGFFAGVLFSRKKQPSTVLLLIYGAFSGVAFSLLMDIWTTLSTDGAFSLSRYLFYVGSSLPVMAVYAVSNVVFLLLLSKPMLRKLNRIRIKYGAFNGNKQN